MDIGVIRLLFEYNEWADRRIMAASLEVSQEEYAAAPRSGIGRESIRASLHHILNSERGWRLICQGEPRVDWDAISEEACPTAQGLAAQWQTEENAMRAYLGSLTDADLETTVRYMDDDIPRERTLWHCLVHLVNHGTQHRSEAAVLLTRAGRSPGDVDFTLFLNEHFPA